MTYESGSTGGSYPGSGSSGRSPNVDITAAMVTPADRVRWGPIIAGLFAALTTLAVLSVLGLAIGLSAYDAGDTARNFGIGAGIWGVISALVAFFLGGWLAARSAAVRGTSNAVLNGAMVWVVAIPLLLYMLGGMGFTAANTAADSATGVAAGSESRDLADRAEQASARITDAVTPDTTARTEEAADRGAKTAWWTLAALLLGFGAAATGGYVGTRDRSYEREDDGYRPTSGGMTSSTAGGSMNT